MRAIDFSRLRSLTAREIIHGLQRDGFVLISQTGSHRQFHHTDGRRLLFHTTVPAKLMQCERYEA